jgi:hypothetical protein
MSKKIIIIILEFFGKLSFIFFLIGGLVYAARRIDKLIHPFHSPDHDFIYTFVMGEIIVILLLCWVLGFFFRCFRRRDWFDPPAKMF